MLSEDILYLSVSPFYIWGNWGLKRLTKLPKTTQKQTSNPGLFDILDIFCELRFLIWIQDKKGGVGETPANSQAPIEFSRY